MTMHGTKLLRAALLLSAATGIACAVGPVAADTTVKTTKDIEYARVADHSLRLDLYEPAAGNAPLLVWVHGGAWERGSKTPMPLTGLVDRGYAVASLDFRPASAARFPGQVHDIKAAIRFLRAAAPRYGYDARRIGILGASSGGHLAALVGTSNGQADLEGTLGDYPNESSAVQAIVSYFGASNLTTILAQSTPFGLGIRKPALKSFLGALPEEDEAVARLASPIFRVDASDPPLLLLHGDQDPQMPINQSHELQGQYQRTGLQAELIVVHGAAHGGEEFYTPENTNRVAAFLDAHLRRTELSSAQR
jgi:acetyl esterase/lipase